MIMKFYTIIVLSCIVSFYGLKFKPFGEFVQASASIFAFIVVMVVPVLILAYLAKHWDNLESI